MDAKALKRAMRRDVVARVRALDPDRRAEEQAALDAAFPTLPGLAGAEWVLLYATAFPEEIETGPFLSWALDSGRRLVCPRVDRAANRLRLFRIEDPDRDFVPGVLGIPEPGPDCPPVEPGRIDWVLVPGVAFDPRGYRVGRGAGHYDRLLPTLRAGVPRWALAFDAQWVDEVPAEPHDVAIDGVVSPSRMARRASG
jgi:5-formyltetrahydrofolate cyclo-ligase